MEIDSSKEILFDLVKESPDGTFLRHDIIEEKTGLTYDKEIYKDLIASVNGMMRGVAVLVENSWIGYTVFKRQAHPVKQTI